MHNRTMIQKLTDDKLSTADRQRTTGGNIVFASMAGDVGKSALVHLINFCAGRQISP
jgi:uncharacterized protein YydD (DUF2326 family)